MEFFLGEIKYIIVLYCYIFEMINKFFIFVWLNIRIKGVWGSGSDMVKFEVIGIENIDYKNVFKVCDDWRMLLDFFGSCVFNVNFDKFMII